MFKHLLLPTDGSEASQATVLKGVRLAKEFNARITGISVVPEFHVLTFNTTMIEDTREVFIAESRSQALRYLALLSRAADEAGVPCETEVVLGDQPYEAILSACESRGCDLIMMASHGRRGLQALLIGSETQKVLTHSKVPVLVYR